MGTKLVQDSSLSAIADAIRAKTGENETMTMAQMPVKIAGISTGITPIGTKQITANGTYDVTAFASAAVGVKTGIFPSIRVTNAAPFAAVTATDGVHSYSATADNRGEAVISGIGQAGAYIVSDAQTQVAVTIADAYCANLRSVPTDYQRVEWLEAAHSNGAYIDLGIAFDTKAKTEITFYTTSATGHLFGAAENSGRLRYLASFPYSGMWYLYGSNGSAFNEATLSVSAHPTGHIYTFTMLAVPGLLSLTDADTELSVSVNTQGSYTMTRNLYLLGQNYNTGYRGEGQKRVYAFKHWDKNDALVRDMVPCYRKADHVIGMYDLVSRAFFTNAGAGVFTCGGDVN